MTTELRRPLLQQRAALSSEESRVLSEKVLAVFLDALKMRRFALRPGSAVALYLGQKGEPEVQGLESYWMNHALRVAYPRVIDGGQGLMEFREGTASSLSEIWNGIRQPDVHAPEIDFSLIQMVFVPGVAFGPGGERLGRGKGFYDRALAKMPQALKVSLAFDFQFQPPFPQQPWDQRVDWILTEKREVFTERAHLWFNRIRNGSDSRS